jgi:flagellar hook-associated protein 3 FlgL
MISNRVTGQTQIAEAKRNLASSSSRMGELQQRATDRLKITKPSDDPAATATAMKVRGELRANVQYGRNIDNGNAWLTAADAALTRTTDLLGRVRDLTIQGATGTTTAEGREAIALELDGLKNEVLAAANTQYLGRNIFAGNSDTGAAFAPNFSFSGAAGSTVERRIGSSEVIRVDADGAAIFGSGAASAFAMIDSIAADMRAGTITGAQVGDVDTFMAKAIGGQSDIGARQARLLRAEGTNMDNAVALEARRTNVEDLDLADIAMDLSVQTVNYQAALQVTSKVLGKTLMDFIQ